MELISENSWTAWAIALAIAIAGQIAVVSGDRVARIAIGTTITLLGIGGAVFIERSLDPATILAATALLAAISATSAWALLKTDVRELGATCFVISAVATLKLWVSHGANIAEKWL